MKVFVGYDSREDIAYRVCEYSIKARSFGVEVIPIKQSELREEGIYTREPDALSSTEFTFTRFLVPYLTGYTGWAIFVDCDFLFQCDVTEIFNSSNSQYAVMCVKHDYTPQEGDKMDGCKQMPYPRKNWSSMILWNCGHPANADLTPEMINDENNSGQFFHRFQWLADELIGELSYQYNWLVNWYHEPQDGHAKAIHYTEGGPWFENYRHCEYGYQWAVEHAAMIESLKKGPAPGPFDHIPKDIETVFKKILKYRVDPSGEIYNTTVDDVIEDIKMLDNNAAVAVDGGRDPNDGKGLGWDPYMESFIRSRVFSNKVHPPKSMNCFGLDLKEGGKSLVPAPPHNIIGLIFTYISA